MTRQPYMCVAIFSVSFSIFSTMKRTESGFICSIHF
jgi:hypothetical protein